MTFLSSFEDFLHSFHQVRRFVFSEAEIGVACDPKRHAFEDMFVGEELVDGPSDHIFEQHVGVAAIGGQSQQSRDGVSAGDPGEAGRSVGVVIEANGDAQRTSGQQRALGVGRHGHRGQHRVDFVVDDLREDGFLHRVDRIETHSPDAFDGEHGFELVAEAGILVGDHFPDPQVDQFELSTGSQSDGVVTSLSLAIDHLQPADSDHEELVQVRRGDGEELESFEERVARVGRLVEHALVEFQPTEFSVDEQVVVGGHETVAGAELSRV